MYKKLDSTPNYPNIEQSVLEFWRANDIKKKVLNLNRDSAKTFSFYEGPPTANGEPHAGHVLTRSLKDIYTRFRGMSGYFVPRKGGWDTHGLPVEIAVEKALGISGKHDIESYGVAKFVEECKKNVWGCIDKWKEFSDAVGYSLDLEEDCYNPYENSYIESIWWSLSELDKKGYLYKGYKVLPSCPSCQTALSSHEVAQGYKDRQDLTVTAKVYCGELDAYLLVWTTTPWTLFSNVGLCVNPKEEYSLVESEGVRYILASALLGKNFGDTSYTIVKTYKGKELEGKAYTPLFEHLADASGTGYRVVSDNYVTMADGTGIVHIAPAYGEDDNRVGKAWGLPFLQLAGGDGRFVAKTGEYAGKSVFDENINIVKELAGRGLVFSKAKYNHSYPHCWRCSTPLIYFARDAWFVKTTAYKQDLLKVNNKINWFPKSFKVGRMGNFLKGNVDWCLSRDRYWGTPLNVWKCDCGHYKTVGSIEELVRLSGCDPNIELHKPFIDEVKFPCGECGALMVREPEVIDVWYDSGAMPFAQHHYPFENKDIFETRYPADFIFEGYDQTRGWFYSLMAIATGLFGVKPPIKNCLANGMICDSSGRKMSKRLGNYTDPMESIKTYGGDTVRFMFYHNSQPYNDVIFSESLLVETQRKFLNTLYNCYAFFVLYADIDKFAGPNVKLAKCELATIDRYILSRLNSLVRSVTKNITKYMATEAARELVDFVDILSNWYIRRCRKRFWGSGMTSDKQAAYATLYTVLSTLSKLCAPFIPFLSEEIYQTIERPFVKDAPKSVHLCKYPKVISRLIDADIEDKMALTYSYCELGRSARSEANLKIRQPLSKVYIRDNASDTMLPGEYKDIIKDELNIHEIVESSDIDRFVSYNLKPQLKTLGPKYGRLIGAIREYLASCDTAVIVACVNNGDVYKASIAGEIVSLTRDDLLITTTNKDGYSGANDGRLSVVLDTVLTQDLIEEYYCREFVSKVQAIRKSHSFDIVARVKIYVTGSKRVTDALAKNIDSLKKDILMSEFWIQEPSEDTKANAVTEDIDVDDRVITVWIGV